MKGKGRREMWEEEEEEEEENSADSREEDPRSTPFISSGGRSLPLPPPASPLPPTSVSLSSPIPWDAFIKHSFCCRSLRSQYSSTVLPTFPAF